MTTAVLWSGGKDFFAAALRSGALAQPETRLVTFVPAGEPAAFRCHPLGLMARQAAGLGLVHERIPIARDNWEADYRRAFAALAAEGIERIVTGDVEPEAWPWLRAATDAVGLRLETPLAGTKDPSALLDELAAAGIVATVSGMRADCYRPSFLGQPASRALLREHGLEDPASFHPCGERGEYHTVVTCFHGQRFVEEDPATLAQHERDGIWALDWWVGLASSRPISTSRRPPRPPSSTAWSRASSTATAPSAAKDARFDGWFVTAVTTTGIYCRPELPGRHAQARERPLPPQRGRRPAGRLPRVQALPPRRRPGLAASGTCAPTSSAARCG